ncbi:hypothetical protein GS910_01545 [Paraburkholderia sp. RL16-012-BIC-B]|nr:hypothetical protein [Paraburkholderia madseniana]
MCGTSRFYELLARLEGMALQGASLASVLAGAALPQRGVYFFREAGEMLLPSATGAAALPRITRVGTHAVSAGSKSTLRARLRAHLGAKSGRGSHRSSIFRLHVGNALLGMEAQTLATWGVGSIAPKALTNSDDAKAAEAAIERRVSMLIGAMPVLWINVPDDAGPASERAVIERGAIALLSNSLAPLVAPSIGWLGRHSIREEIRASGLWNLRHVEEHSDLAFLDVLERAVERTLINRPNEPR